MYQKLVCSVMLAACALAAVPSATHAQVQNLVLNPSFETDEVILNDPDWEQWCTWNPDDVTGSVAEIDETELTRLRKQLSWVKLDSDDSIRLYRLCEGCVKTVQIWGAGEVTKDPDIVVL